LRVSQQQPFYHRRALVRGLCCMAEQPTPEDIALWQRRLASQANNRAWTLAEVLHRSPEEDEEMLQAAHAAMYFWKIVGAPANQPRAAQLLAHVYALLKLPGPAAHYLGKSLPHFAQHDCAPWELAFAHAVAANVASAQGDAAAYASHYAAAKAAAERITDAQTRAMFGATLRVVTAPNP
jgi:NAD(P)-dependent dehydrogenase (short-subunit alcohol dehydrogenase family)